MTACHPIILDGNNAAVKLLVQHKHEINGHCGPEQTRNTFRKSYWILRCRAVVKQTIREIEASMNSRPLTNVPYDINDPLPLTPNHFLLVVHPLTCVFIGKEKNVSKSWRSAQQIATHFWNLFLREYLPTQQRVRCKQHNTSKNLQVVDLVWIIEDFIPRGLWPLARVIQVFPDTDGIVRSVKLKKSFGERIRPVVKLSKVFAE